MLSMETIHVNDFPDDATRGKLSAMQQATVLHLRPAPPPPSAPLSRPVEPLSTSEVAECTCPGWCERDHEQD